MNPAPVLHLASTSPRRREILDALRLEFSVVRVDVDETPLEEETPTGMVLRLATAKAAAAAVNANDIALGADTAVVIDGEALGKPVDKADGLAMLAALSGRSHKVVTGVAVSRAGQTHSALSESEVIFREISQDEALAYWQSGEPCDKAGAYAVQGIGGIFVERIKGSYSGVVGLPVFETVALLQGVGLDVLTKQKIHD